MLLVIMKDMIEVIKTLPLIQWLKWIIRSRKLIRRYPTLKIGSMAEISHSCSFGQYNVIYKNAVIIDSSLGDYSYVGGGKIQYATIGKFCSIADGVRIGLGIHPTDLPSTHPAFYSSQSKWNIKPDLSLNVIEYKRVIIGDDVWIGTNSIVLDGVKIGNHAIIAAGAVVTKDVPDYAVVGGIPAKIIKYRKVERYPQTDYL